jgi:hypothetical protein
MISLSRIPTLVRFELKRLPHMTHGSVDTHVDGFSMDLMRSLSSTGVFGAEITV